MNVYNIYLSVRHKVQSIYGDFDDIKIIATNFINLTSNFIFKSYEVYKNRL